MNMKNNNVKFVFFGTPDLAVFVLEELEKGGLLPCLVVTAPDRPAGRGMKLTPPPVKVWAEERNIPVLQPEKLDSDFIDLLVATQGLTSSRPADSSRTDLSRDYQLFIVAAYGKIIPQSVLNVPEHGALNVHPSLLPKYRGASPLQSTILSGDTETGVTIILMDEDMDHGPIVGIKNYELGMMENAEQLGEALFRIGGEMLVDVIPKWIAREIAPQEQDHDKATYTKKIAKEDGLIDLDGDSETNWLKFRAYHPWPGVYFFKETADKRGKIRVKITGAELKDDKLVIKRVIPANEKEISYEEFAKRLNQSS